MPTATTTVLSSRIAATDAWGRDHSATIVWMPLPLTGLSAANDNFRKTEVAWADVNHAPAWYAVDRADGRAKLRTDRHERTGDFAWVVEPTRVASRDELEPGAFCLEDEHCTERRSR